MANTVRLKRSNTALAAPSLLYGELGWNSADSKLFVGSFANTAVQLGSVTTLSVVTANGVSGSVATATSTPAITVTLGAITPSSVTVSGVITCSAGSVALPSITTSGDTNTGIYFPAADSVSTSVGGVEKLRIDSNGVGIGVREGGGVDPSTYYLSTQANAGLTILHAAKAGTVSANHTKRHLMAYVFNTVSGVGGSGIMRIKIPVISAGGSLRLTVKNTPFASAQFCRAWEITLCDYVTAGFGFTKDTFSVTGSPNFSRVRLMTDGTDRYLVLGYFVAGAGTVSTASSTTVTGSGTSFLSLFRVGDAILIAGTWSYISAIASDTSLTVAVALGVNTAVTYSRGDSFATPQITIDADVGNIGSAVQVNTAFAIDFAQSESTLSLVSAANDIWLTNTNSQHSFVGVGTQRPTSLFHVKAEKIGQGTVSNSAAGTTVTGVNTLFLDQFKIGDSITIPSAGTAATPQTVVISAIASNTSMTTAAITSANSAVSYSLAGGTLFSVAGNGTITTSSSGNTLSGTNTGDQTAASLGLVIGTNVQAYDAGLLSIAAATTAADRFLYTTALDVYAVGTITTFGRSLVDDADASTARTTLGLVIGTDVAPIAGPTFTGVLTTAGQIAFPAAVNLSAGANTLDDYEEGTWTPVVTPSAGAITTYTSSGIYTKIGRSVTVIWTFTVSSIGTGSGFINCAGLPFAAATASSGDGVQVTTRVAQSVAVASAATTATVAKYDATYPVSLGSIHVLSMSYTTTS